MKMLCSVMTGSRALRLTIIKIRSGKEIPDYLVWKRLLIISGEMVRMLAMASLPGRCLLFGVLYLHRNRQVRFALN